MTDVESIRERDLVRANRHRARRLILTNRKQERRITSGDRRRGRGLWVYGRAGRACRRCGDAIARGRLGNPPRLTYRCPGCQRLPTGD